MRKKKMSKQETATHKKQEKSRWNETELRLATGAATIVTAFILSQITGVSPDVFYGSFQRFISGFFVLVLLYLIIYVILYKRYRA
jgi:hypothetical protein